MTTTLRGVELPQLFQTRPGTVSLTGGLPDLTVFPVREFADLSARLLRLGGRTLLQYTTPHVSPKALPAVLDLAAREEMRPEAAGLVPTAGSQQGLVAIASVLDSDVVMCESPAYPGAIAAFAHAGIEPQPVACDGEGILIEELTRRVTALRASGRRVGAVYVVPTFANPTGVTQSCARRHSLLDACARLDLLVIEDNPYGLLAFEGQQWPALKSLAPERVVYLGTFSKVFVPGLRVGWIDAPGELSASLRTAVEVLALSPSPFVQAAIGEFHRLFGWDELIGRYRASYRHRARVASGGLRAALDEQGAEAARWYWREPRGGFYLWLTSLLPADAMAVAAAAAAAGVAVIPGPHFGMSAEHSSSLRICYANAPLDKLEEGVRRLGGVLASARTIEAARR